MNYFLKTLCAVCVILFFAGLKPPAEAQPGGGITLTGKVYNTVTKRPVEFGTVVVLEARAKSYTENDGSYRVLIQQPGEYTVIIRSDDLKPLTVKMNVRGNAKRDFFLQPITIRGEGITITGTRDIQKVSRYTMTVKELKDVPGSFGDSVNALTSMPGVIRTDGPWGPMVVRGANPIQNRYLIDDIPIYHPIHFFGIHSVINNNLMSEIDLFSSAFPVQYGNGNAALISINTLDDVREFGGYVDVGLISAAALIHAPILRNPSGNLEFAPPSYIPVAEDGYRNVGYIIASGRVGYLSLFVPLIYELVTGERPPFVPEYWDYQLKMKYYFNSRNSVTLLLMGSSDYLVFDDDKANAVDPESGDDPLFSGFRARADWQSNSQGLYYTWQPNDRFWNKMIFFSALINNYTYFTLPNAGVSEALQDINVDSRPYIFGFKDTFRLEPVKENIVIRGGFEYTYYYFRSSGKTLMTTSTTPGFDPADPDAFVSIYLDETIKNSVVGGFVQTRFKYGWFSLEPGVRADYLDRTGVTTIDPRGLFTAEFPTETTISLAGGRYSYFFQTNPYLFIDSPQIAGLGKELKPERAIHRVAGIEQRFGDYTVKVEGFYNNFYDMAEGYYHKMEDGTPIEGMSSGKIRARGFEIMLKKEQRENETGLYGWINYTFTRSSYKSGLPTEAGVGHPDNTIGDLWGDQWIDYYYEQRHNVKMVAGYNFKAGRFRGIHTVSTKLQFYSSLPYTPIVSSQQDMVYTGPGERHIPLYGKTNTARFGNDHQLDLRYSYRVNHSWGYVSWYVEVLNVLGHWLDVEDEYFWDYRYSHNDPAHENPTIRREEGLNWVPNFGVEIKF